MQFKPLHEVTELTYTVTHHADAGQLGKRLDHFLCERHRSRSREAIQRAIQEGLVTLERNQSQHLSAGRAKPSTLLIPGDIIKVLTHRKPEPHVSFDYQVLHQDAVLLIIDKPAQLPVHPAGRYFFNTLLIHLRTEGHRKLEISANREFFLPHRIDKETSGVLVLTRTTESCAHIVAQFAGRQTEKTYLAVVYGHPEQDEFTVDAPLRRDPKSLIGLKMMTTSADDPLGQNAFTQFRVRERVTNAFGKFSLVECYPKTGRQHQIRVHLEKTGHPIVGDKLYGIEESLSVGFYERKHLTSEAQHRLILPRHALHAHRLSFLHPITQKPHTAESPLPKDLADFLRDQTRKTLSTWHETVSDANFASDLPQSDGDPTEDFSLDLENSFNDAAIE